MFVWWAGEPDGTQSGLSEVEMTVRRPTVVPREVCENHVVKELVRRIVAFLKEDAD